MIADTLLADENFAFKDGLFYQKEFSRNDFESTYIDIRKKEGRLLTNEEVVNLPDIDENHIHFNEWQIRKRSLQRLLAYLQRKPGHKIILEVGCGNGWLSHHLSTIKNVEVIGLDINATELTQAGSVFQRTSNLRFIMGNVFTLNLSFKIDYIVLASSVQYFPDIEVLLTTLLQKIPNHGEIHILDTPFYREENVNRAKARSKQYFESQHSKMPAHYHHHCWEDLRNFDFTILYNPLSIISKLKNVVQVDSPFPWIKIIPA